jgi:predicted nucleotidyltransferase
MQSRSSPSVKVTWFDRPAAWKAVRALAEDTARRHPEVDRVVVFGSLVRQETVPGSDVDVLILLSHSDQPFLSRIPAFLPRGLDGRVSMDVFPYTRQEVEALLNEGNFFLRQALREGVVLFDRETVSRVPGQQVPERVDG